MALDDVLVVGSGPAGLAIAAALCGQGLRVAGLAPEPPDTPWVNTYGIWADELAPLGLEHLLSHRWERATIGAHGAELAVDRAYGLFDSAALQRHLLGQCERGGMRWQLGAAAGVSHGAAESTVTTRDGAQLRARLVVDAGGHRPPLARRPEARGVAFQVAYGVVGTFDGPPVAPGQLTLMDFRADHLPPGERAGPPTFLYAMDLGGGRFFAEETSLAAAPAVSLKLLERRLHLRLAARGSRVREAQHVERCVFPMNSPLPDLRQPLLAYGGAASMVHPISGYQVGGAMRRAPEVAAAVAAALGGGGGPAEAARAGWGALWPAERLRQRSLYLFGLASLLRLDERQIQSFFAAFFRLPRRQWTGYLSDRLSAREIAAMMLSMFAHLPNHTRLPLVGAAGREHALLRQALLIS